MESDTGGGSVGSPHKLGHIDAARGIAILMVMLVHHTQAVAKVTPLDSITSLIGGYGQMGVQLFFVASALTLCLSQDRRRDDLLWSFYLRRFFRIAPLYYLAISLYGAVFWLTHGGRGEFTPSAVVANLLFIHGFVPSAINSVVPGGWSIGAEMAFYAVFPFLFAFAADVDRRWGPAPLVLGALGLFVAYVFAWRIIPLVTHFVLVRDNIFYYWPPGQAPVFAIGMAAYFLFRRWCSPLWLDLLGIALPTAVSLALWRSGYAAAFAIIPGCSAISFVALINLLAKLPHRHTVVHAIGRASYSMYILHFLAVWFVTPIAIRALAPYLSGVGVLVLTYPITVGVTYAVAALTKPLIEDRWISMGGAVIRLLRGRTRAVAA